MTGWELVYDAVDPEREGVRETLCTLGNGYVATRGAAEESIADGVHYPGTYIAGCYNRLVTPIGAQLLEHEDLVNVPNWLPLTFREPGRPWFGAGPVEILAYRQVLDLRRGLLTRDLRIRDERDRRTRITTRRLVHMGDPHLAALETTLTAENWSGTIEVRSALDGQVANRGVDRYRLLGAEHLAPVSAREVGSETILLEVRTSQSGIQIAEAARTRVLERQVDRQVDRPVARPCERHTIVGAGVVSQELVLELTANRPVTIEKTVAIYTSRDRAISACGIAASEKLADAPGFDALLESHALAWAHLWRYFDLDLEVEGDGERGVDVILRLHVFHLLQTASRHVTDLDVGAGARGLHGEGYRGHVFWDDLFVFPLLNLRMPDITRALLMYRFRRLGAARRAATAAGHRGAMYPWQSGSDGREETPEVYFNPRSGRWMRDDTEFQRHVGAAIVYNVWQYYQVTGDRKFLEEAGAEMVLEIARFFASLTRYDRELDRFEIRGVVGPDEYHTRYPDAAQPGVDNNAYTNLMAAWVLWRALDVLNLLPHGARRELRDRLRIDDAELAAWDAISRKMRLLFLDGGVLAQFEGYDRLAELDLDAYQARYGTLYRLDFILEAEGDSTDRYKVSKQADVLMLFFLFSSEELRALFERLGYPFEGEMIPRTIDYYLRRTTNGSTLSRVAHTWVLARSDRPGSWGLFREALVSDVSDIQGGTTREGIHLGAMAGTVDIALRCFTGVELRGDVLWINPRLPTGVRRLAFLARYRTHTLRIAISPSSVEVSAEECEIPSMQVGIRDDVHELMAGERRTFALPPR